MNERSQAPGKNLILLVADKNMEAVMDGLLGRPQALGIKQISYDSFVHPRHDPGCLNGASDFLRPFAGDYQHALVMFDHEGCGREHVAPAALADEVNATLARGGWAERAEVVVLAPELEAWAWTGSPHVPRCLGWADQEPRLREWLAAQGHWPPDEQKPQQPKAAFEAALREVRKPRSSAIYGEIARSVSLKGHTDPAFVHLTEALRTWFSL